MHNNLWCRHWGNRCRVWLDLWWRGRDRVEPLEKPDNDAGDSKNDQQDARPGTLDNPLTVQYPENRSANQQKNGNTNNDEAPLMQLLALPCFTLLLILLLRRHSLYPSWLKCLLMMGL